MAILCFAALLLADATPTVLLAGAPTVTSSSNNTYCSACEYIAEGVKVHGCGWAKTACAEMPTPANALCAWLVSDELCPFLKNASSASPKYACTELGLCGTDCECGVCTKEVASPTGRCLGAPNSCGHHAASIELDDAWPGCLDGRCNATTSVGCCLSCF